MRADALVIDVALPNYSDGYRKGFEDAHAEIRQAELSSVFHRDASHVLTLHALARAIEHGLATVGACEDQDRCSTAATKLANELEVLNVFYRERGIEHASEQKRLSEGRRS